MRFSNNDDAAHDRLNPEIRLLAREQMATFIQMLIYTSPKQLLTAEDIRHILNAAMEEAISKAFDISEN